MATIQLRSKYVLHLKGEPKIEIVKLEDTVEMGLDVSLFPQLKMKLLAKEGDKVRIGAPLLEDKKVEGRIFVSPAGGVVKKIVRGDKRKIICIVIEKDKKEEAIPLEKIDIAKASGSQILHRLSEIGAFAYIRKRPCDVLASPHALPRSIFVQGLESAPFTPSPLHQLEGIEHHFKAGLLALSKLAPVHLVTAQDSPLLKYGEECKVEAHIAKGPHPIANPSIHIEHIDPISSFQDIVWTIKALDVAYIGAGVEEGKFLLHQLVALAGEGVKEGERRYYLARRGSDIHQLLESKLEKEPGAVLRGDPLCGEKIDIEQQFFLRWGDSVICTLKEKEKPNYLHFCKGGINRFTLTKAYLYRFFNKKAPVSFSALMHGEKRAFIDGSYYDKVMPLKVLTMPLIKALLSSDYEKALQLGLLEVAPEDFALPSLICPSKIDHIGIVKKGLEEYSSEYLE